MNLPDIPFTSAEAAQYKIDWAPSTGYLKKIKPMMFLELIKAPSSDQKQIRIPGDVLTSL